MGRKIWFWCAICAACLPVACDESDSSPTILLVSPQEMLSEVKAGEKLSYTVEAFANTGLVEKIKVSSYDPQRGVIVLLDSTIGTTRTKFDFLYTAPALESDSVTVKLTFEVRGEGSDISILRFVKISGGDVLLREEAGFTMYSARSSKPDAFRLSDSQMLLSQLEPDSLIDIYDYHPAVLSDDTLTCEWRSGSGLKFSRVENFNYALATETGVKSVYLYSEKQKAIRGIHAEDVILVGNDREALAVIKIMNAIDEPGAANDRYVFNLKKIVSKTNVVGKSVALLKKP